MAIINNNNVGNVKFLRNGQVYNSHELAYAALTGFTLTSEQDGTAILARYTAEDTNVKTLVGWVYKNGNTEYITIQDVEGASGDVDKLRREINAKLGEGVTSANTVTSQLEALSGATFTAGTSSSADTSVEGAKAYAYDLVGTLDGSVSAETGYYVKSVSEVDGKINGTTEALPTVADEASAKTFVTSVSENLGEISVSKGTITSSGKTIVLTDNADGGVNFEANVDGTTIIVDENTGVMSVASSALVQYEGDDDTIQISAVREGVRTVSSPLTIEKVTTGLDADVREAYRLVGHSGNTIGDLVKIYKDSSLLSVALLHADTTADPQVLPTYNKETDTWTDIPTPTEANQALCFAYENVSGATVVAAVPVGAFINEQEFASGITWDSVAGKVKGVVDSNSESFLTVGADGFKLSGVQDAIDAAVASLDATVNNNANSGHVAVEIVETDGKLVSVTVTEDDIASADAIEELSGKTVTEISSSNASISATSAATADGTVGYDLVTDASKIQMSGFTADNSKVFSGISESDSIADAFEKADTVVTGIRSDVNTVSGDVDTIKEQYISGISVNGNAVTVASHVAPISITAATSATTALTANAIVVDTDANGNITLGLNYIDCGTY